MSKVIPRNDRSAFERWELPAVQGNRLPAGPGGVVTVEGVETVQQQAHEEGYAKGYGEGLAAGKAQSQRFEQLMTALHEPFVDLDQQVEQELLLLVKVVARQLVRRELRSEPDQIVAVVREAMAALPVATRDVRLQLHPEDAALVCEVLSLEQADRPWRIVEDPVLPRGDCRVVTDTSQVDATLESRLTTLVTSIMGGDRGHDEPRDS